MAAKRVHKLEVGIRELRANLSRFIDDAKAGREIVITEHGRAVARLVPTPGTATLDRLVNEGLVTPPRKAKTPASETPAVKLRGRGPSLAEIVIEQRR